MGKPLEKMHGHVAYNCKFCGYYLRKPNKKITGIGILFTKFQKKRSNNRAIPTI